MQPGSTEPFNIVRVQTIIKLAKVYSFPFLLSFSLSHTFIRCSYQNYTSKLGQRKEKKEKLQTTITMCKR